MLLQKVGISNESNSLYKQIIQEIQQASRNYMSSSMTRPEIINCIKASSFGMPSNLEPAVQTYDHKNSKILKQAFSDLNKNVMMSG